MKSSEFRKYLAKQAESLGDAISGLSSWHVNAIDGHAEANRLWALAGKLRAEARELAKDGR